MNAYELSLTVLAMIYILKMFYNVCSWIFNTAHSMIVIFHLSPFANAYREFRVHLLIKEVDDRLHQSTDIEKGFPRPTVLSGNEAAAKAEINQIQSTLCALLNELRDFGRISIRSLMLGNGVDNLLKDFEERVATIV